MAQLFKRGASLHEIARTIETSVNTVSREIHRNRCNIYSTTHAYMLAQERIEWCQYSRRFHELFFTIAPDNSP